MLFSLCFCDINIDFILQIQGFVFTYLDVLCVLLKIATKGRCTYGIRNRGRYPFKLRKKDVSRTCSVLKTMFSSRIELLSYLRILLLPQSCYGSILCVPISKQFRTKPNCTPPCLSTDNSQTKTKGQCLTAKSYLWFHKRPSLYFLCCLYKHHPVNRSRTISRYPEQTSEASNLRK